jgi:MFS family permease
MHGFLRQAETTMDRIELDAQGRLTDAHLRVKVALVVTGTTTLVDVVRTVFVSHRRRALLGLAMMVAQAFFYNAIFFSYGVILERFHGVDAARIGLYAIPFAIGNFMGPILLGPLFDRIGRRVMIPLTYALSAVLLTATGALFVSGRLDATSQTAAWCGTFFFASSAASSAYLTVSELFPVHVRGIAIAIFYAIATLAGAGAPLIFGAIVDAADPRGVFAGYIFASALMMGAAVIARVFGIASEGRPLEDLSS